MCGADACGYLLAIQLVAGSEPRPCRKLASSFFVGRRGEKGLVCGADACGYLLAIQVVAGSEPRPCRALASSFLVGGPASWSRTTSA